MNIQSHFLPVEGEPPRLAGDTYLMYLFDDKSKRVFPSVIAGCSTFSYNGTFFTAYKATWATPDGSEIYFYDLVADSEDAGKDLAQKVYVYGETLREEIWVYQSGRWTANKQLYQAIQAANWNDVILDDSFKDGLRRDTQGFFESKDIYDDLGTVWKRLVLVLFFFCICCSESYSSIHLQGYPTLGYSGKRKDRIYQSAFERDAIPRSLRKIVYHSICEFLPLQSRAFPDIDLRIYDRAPNMASEPFSKKARHSAPCILVLEDLDAMVVPKVRSFFLNELDGLAANAGILTIATTNHPERIDDAIVNRPSRFDVKYNFALPDIELRKAFAKKWIEKFGGSGEKKEDKDDTKPVTRAKGVKFAMEKEDIATKVAEMTEGFSFAFLKEL